MRKRRGVRERSSQGGVRRGKERAPGRSLTQWRLRQETMASCELRGMDVRSCSSSTSSLSTGTDGWLAAVLRRARIKRTFELAVWVPVKSPR